MRCGSELAGVAEGGSFPVGNFAKPRAVIFVETRMSFPQVKVKSQSICDFFNASLIADGITGRRNYGRLPTESMVFANADVHFANAQRPDDLIEESVLTRGKEFFDPQCREFNRQGIC
jgi:hypothetical protein